MINFVVKKSLCTNTELTSPFNTYLLIFRDCMNFKEMGYAIEIFLLKIYWLIKTQKH